MQIRRLTPAAGAEISGIDLSAPLSDEARKSINAALFAYGAIFFRGQKLDFDGLLAFAECFGKPEVHPIVLGMEGHPAIIKMHKPAGEAASFGVDWHSDNSFFPAPSLGSILFAETVPPVGGDTLFASQQAAFDRLSPAMKTMLRGLKAVHTAREAYSSLAAQEKYDGKGAIRYRRSNVLEESVEHDVVIRHPATGREALYVNPMFTTRFAGMSEEESRPLLEFLFAHAIREEFQCRFRWEAGSVAFWDNRIIQHAALNDYQDYERLIYRVTIEGEPLSRDGVSNADLS